MVSTGARHGAGSGAPWYMVVLEENKRRISVANKNLGRIVLKKLVGTDSARAGQVMQGNCHCGGDRIIAATIG